MKICAACKSDLTGSVRAERKEVWKKIPEWFGLVRTEKNEVRHRYIVKALLLDHSDIDIPDMKTMYMDLTLEGSIMDVPS